MGMASGVCWDEGGTGVHQVWGHNGDVMPRAAVQSPSLEALRTLEMWH